MSIEVRQKIRAFFRRRKRMPSMGELAKLAGFKSKNAAFKLIERLAEADFLEKDSTGRLIPGRLFHDVRVLGEVEAGWPSPAEEELKDTITLDDWLIQNKEATYILKVSGDSMIEAGILPGDSALVERTANCKDGDIVIAEVDSKFTIKRFRKRGNRVYLEAANKKYAPIVPEEELKVLAVVKAVIRKY